MKPKRTNTGNPHKSHKMDQCQTPHYALDPLLPYLPKHWLIWESACGNGHIVTKLESEGYRVIGTDILSGADFFRSQPDSWDCQVTNPPYSERAKYDWIEHSYRLGKPFALLMPLETMAAAKAQKWLSRFGVEIILPDKRINFSMPNQGYNGGGAQFATAWFTFGLQIGSPLTFVKMHRYADAQPSLLEAAP